MLSCFSDAPKVAATLSRIADRICSLVPERANRLMSPLYVNSKWTGGEMIVISLRDGYLVVIQREGREETSAQGWCSGQDCLIVYKKETRLQRRENIRSKAGNGHRGSLGMESDDIIDKNRSQDHHRISDSIPKYLFCGRKWKRQ